MKTDTFISSQKGLTRTAILIIGLIFSLSICVTFFSYRYISANWSPSLKNSERLLKAKKYDQALNLAKKVRAKGKGESDILALQGKIWLSKAWERQNRENWKNYGKNENDWLTCVEAKKAEHYLQKAIKKNPNNHEAHYYLARLYFEKGWFSRAESKYMDVLHLKKNHIQSLIDLGALYVKLNQYGLAEGELKRAYRLDPKDPVIAKNIHILYRYYKDIPESALVWSNKYLNLEPKGDLDMFYVLENHEQMLERYPDFTLPEKQNWKKEKRFKPRN